MAWHGFGHGAGHVSVQLPQGRIRAMLHSSNDFFQHKPLAFNEVISMLSPELSTPSTAYIARVGPKVKRYSGYAPHHSRRGR
jgi:hypothetical protein